MTASPPLSPGAGAVDAAFATARALIRQGHGGAAGDILDRLAELVPDDPRLAHLRGLIVWKQGDLAAAAAILAAIDPADTAILNDRAALAAAILNDRAALAAAGRDWGQCETLSEAVLAGDPGNRDALHNRALALSHLNRPEAALAAADAALAVSPDDPDLHCLRAGALTLLGEEAGIADALEAVAARHPDHIETRLQLANFLIQRQDWQAAMPHLQAAHAAQPAHPAVLAALGRAMRLAGMPGAAPVLLRAAQAAPLDAHVRNELGMALGALGRKGDAITVFEHALALDPTLEAAWVALAETQRDLGRFADAERTIARGMVAAGSGCFMLSQLAATAAALGAAETAVEAYRQALAKDPWQPAVHTNLIFTLDFVPGLTAADLQAERRRWGARFTPRRPVAPHANDPDPDRRLRIGYVSADLRFASASFAFAAPLLCSDPAAVDLYLYANSAAFDRRSVKFRGAARGWRRVDGMSDRDLAALIRADGIDLLVDLGGHSSNHRLTLFGLKPAPVQVTGWGHSTGTGVEQIDYLFADPIVIPPDERPLFTEQVWDLPCVIGYLAAHDSPPPVPPPCLNRGHITFGSLGRTEKISDTVLELWARILLAVPGSRLFLKDPRLNEPDEQARFAARLARFGVAPGRLTCRGFSSHPEHLAAAGEIDIALDPFPQGGGVTTIETLFMGVPVLTLRGQVIGGRLGTSILHAIGRPDLIADDADAYLALARRLAADPGALARQRPALRAAVTGSGLYGHHYAQAVENAYRAMWRIWCADARQ